MKTKPMKILLVGAYPPPFGGVQVHLANLKKHLESRGHDCFVINLGRNKNIRSRNMASPRSALETAYLLLKHRKYLCHLHYGGTLHLRLILLTLFAGMLFRGRCVATIHSGGLPVWGRHSNPIKTALIRKSFKMLPTIVCVNRQIAGYFRSMDLDKKQIKIVSPFTFNLQDMEDVDLPPRIKTFLTEKKRVICNIGLLEPEYNLESLLRVFKAYNKDEPDSGLVMIGSGSIQWKLEQIISDMNLNDHVILCGDLDHRVTLKILSSSSCYIRASQYDGDCISLREALRLGIPVIASDTGMRPTGARLFKIGNEEELLGIIKNTLRSFQVSEGNRNTTPDRSSLKRVEAILAAMAHPR